MSDKQAGWLSFLLAMLAMGWYIMMYSAATSGFKLAVTMMSIYVNDGGKIFVLREFLLKICRPTAILPLA